VSTEPEKPTSAGAATDNKASTDSDKAFENKAAVERAASIETSTAAVEHQTSSSSAEPVIKKARPVKVEQRSTSGGGSWLSSAALLLALAALAGTAYQWWMQHNAEQEVQAEPWREELLQQAQQSTALESKMDSRLSTIEGEVGTARQQLQAVKQETSSEIAQLSKSDEDLLKQISSVGRTDRDDWKLAEVEYLLRLAHQRVVMGGELNSAASLLTNADNILVELNMAGLHQVRKQVALDLAAVRAAQQLDSEGVYLRLEALQQQASRLPFFGMPTIDENPDAATESPGDLFDLAAEDWQAALDKGWDQAVEKFKTLVVVQKRDGAIEPLLSEAWQRLVRERLALDLEQAKNALVLQQQVIYRKALGNARELVNNHYVTDDPATRSVLKELQELQQEKIVADLPDVSGSQEAIRAYIDQKYQARESAAPVEENSGDATPKPTSSNGSYKWPQMGSE
jgi:uroporphyrin-3 C-methyltransferase